MAFSKLEFHPAFPVYIPNIAIESVLFCITPKRSFFGATQERSSEQQEQNALCKSTIR